MTLASSIAIDATVICYNKCFYPIKFSAQKLLLFTINKKCESHFMEMEVSKIDRRVT